MSIHFAAARAPGSSALARALAYRHPDRIANDNPSDRAALTHLEGALTHFAQFGLGAPRVARREFDAALLRGDNDAAGHWLQICAAFDRRLARSLERRLITA